MFHDLLKGFEDFAEYVDVVRKGNLDALDQMPVIESIEEHPPVPT